MADIILSFFSIIGIGLAIVLSFLVSKFIIKKEGEKEVFLETEYSTFNFYVIIIIIIALADFYFVSFYPTLLDIEDMAIKQMIILIFIILSLLALFLTLKIRKQILNIKISILGRNNRFLNYSFQLIVIQELLVIFFYCIALLSIILEVEMLPGVAFIFDIPEFDIATISDPLELFVILTMTSLKGAFLLVHHSSILVVFVTFFVILSEWTEKTKDVTVRLFSTFALGFIIQSIGQTLQSIASVTVSYVIFIPTENNIPDIISMMYLIGDLVVLFGAVIYYLSFLIATIALLDNISHLILPQSIIKILRLLAMIIPIIYITIYGSLVILSAVIAATGDSATIDAANFIIDITHFLDLFAMILLPLTCGLFFLSAYYTSYKQKEERNKKLSNFVLWTFLSLFLLFGAGNNTLSSLSWFGMLHAPLALLGTLLMLYGLSRVADHASRHRRIIKQIRNNPEEFMFLAELGKAERKIQLNTKVDSLVKTGVIKPLVPTIEKDETETAAEINSYMAEISQIYESRKARRAARASSSS